MTRAPLPFARVAGALVAALPGGTVAFTTRAGGVSAPPYDALNLGPWTDDDPAAVAENRRRAARLADRPLAGLRQVHGTEVRLRTAADADDPDDPGADAPTADAHVTTDEGVALAVLTADCLPILLVSEHAVGAVHAGWKGLADGVVEAGVDALRAVGGLGPVRAVIGPGAGPCCYEVGEEVHAAFADHGPQVRDGRRIDLPAIAAAQLHDLGVGHVLPIGLCTMCDPARTFFSHRRDGGITGRQAGIVWRS